MPAGRRIKLPEPLRADTNLADKAFHLVVKTVAEFEFNVRVVLHRLNIFFIGSGMKNVRLHR